MAHFSKYSLIFVTNMQANLEDAFANPKHAFASCVTNHEVINHLNITMKKFFCFWSLILIAHMAIAQTQIIAHRGFHATKNSVRNSLSALQHAQDFGAFGSECDINETADGVLVVVHGPKHGKYIVQQTDFQTLRAQKLGNGEILPTLDEYLELAAKNTNTKLIIEIKDHNTPQRETRVVKNILKAVKKHKLQNDVEYIAFRKHVCDELIKYGPKGIQVAYLNGDLTPEYCKGLKYTGIDYNIGVLKKNPHWIKEAQKLGMIVNVWTVNDAENLQWCVDQGVDFITTDNPEEAARIISKK